MSGRCQLAVIGAGPAGLAAATVAAELGVDVAVFDEQPGPGGRIYESAERSPLADTKVLGAEYGRGAGLAAEFRASGAAYHPDSEIWLITPEREVGVLAGDALRFVQAERVLIASGAMERAVPFPGWTLPGVMTAGAGQILLKSAGIVPDDGVVLAGSGPLLPLLACQYLRLGVTVKAMLDTTPVLNYARALKHLPRAFLAGDYISKGLAMKREVAAAKIPVTGRVETLRAIGTDRLEAVEYTVGGKSRTIETGLLLVHFGLVPNTILADAAGCRRVWDDQRSFWRPWSDGWGNTDMEGIAVAGDGSAIGGALAAERAGRIVALEVARALGFIDEAERDRRAVTEREALTRDLGARPFLDALFQVPRPTLADDTIVCRCEEVTAGDIRKAVAEGCVGPNQVKAATRCGMGPCQARQCGTTVPLVTAEALKRPVAEIGALRARPPVKPVTLAQLAALGDDGGMS
jgi:NADPH-dependent 2,4-dienoyl-CoA reductase/sulfur reductase-like enzyme